MICLSYHLTVVLQKIRFVFFFFDKKDPKLSLSELLSIRSNGPTDPLHISCICSIWKIQQFYSSFSLNPSKCAFFHALTLSLLPKNHMLFSYHLTVVLQKIRFVFFFFDKKDPKLSLSELLSMMTIIQFNPTLFI
jgi:hypothetical protein